MSYDPNREIMFVSDVTESWNPARDPEAIAQNPPPETMPSYISSELPAQPDLTGDALTDAAGLFDVDKGDIIIYAAGHHLDPEFIANRLLTVANDLGGGLSPEGKRMWLFLRLESGLTLDQAASAAEKYKSTYAT